MRGRSVIGKIFIVCCVTLCCCIDAYKPTGISRNVNFLVVEAFLNATESTCSVTLSRTIPLEGSGMQYESGATVILVDDVGGESSLVEGANGKYSIQNLTLNPNAKYTLTISTLNGEAYESEAVPIYKASIIDSITWHETRNGVAFDVNAHGTNANTGYYYWHFSETWAYNSAFSSVLLPVDDTVRFRDTNNPEEAIYRCYMSKESETILVGSSDRLTNDVIQNFNLTTVPWTSPSILIKYSILVEQRTIDLPAYEYWQQLKKNTEELGTIFDPLPFLPLSNIQCVSDPDKIALGYFNASEVTSKRIFVIPKEVNIPGGTRPVTGYEDCRIIVKLFGEDFGQYLPIEFEIATGGFPAPIGYKVAVPSCVDCRLKGGTSVEPDFWE